MRRLIAAMLLVGVLGTEAMAEKKTAAPAAKTAQTNVADRTGNISKRHREDLLRKIMEIREFFNRSDDKNAVRLRQFADLLAREVRGKKYGLVFEEHRERADVELESNLPILKENAKRFIDHGGEMNFLIEGENLAALKLLEKTHRNRIDFIYIDPPYNTGNKDFIYNDNYVDGKDAFRHSKWLSFMEKRLRIARNILSPHGVIFISINDCELATLRLLCDEIFGESNFVGQLTWESTTQPTNAGKAKFELQKKVESILCFARNKQKKPPFVLQAQAAKVSYPHEGKFGKCRYEVIEKSDAGTYKRDTMKFKILGQYPRPGKRWQIGEETARELERTERVAIVDGVVKKVIYPEDEQEKLSYVPFWSHLTAKDVGTALDGKDELNELLGRSVGFDTVKPLALMTSLIARYPGDVTVLDFFAGSGTTGHAVMRLNAQDGGRRRFILVTDNENGICENVTYERLKRAIKNEGLKARLKYMKIDYLPITEKLYYEYADDLLKNVRELVELENAVDFAHDASVAIVQSDAEYAAFLADEKRLAACRVLYVGHHVLRSAASEATLSARNVELREIPQYYYPELED